MKRCYRAWYVVVDGFCDLKACGALKKLGFDWLQMDVQAERLFSLWREENL